jgi:hypothetical protein
MKTAVEWLVENVIISAPLNWDTTILEQAKELEKEQIKNAWEKGFDEIDRASRTSQNYYKETFKSEEDESKAD